MTQQREFEGKDLAEAIKTAATSLALSEEDLDYEILEQGRRGVFGLGARSVRIRVMPALEVSEEVVVQPPPTAPRVESQRPRRGERPRGGGQDAPARSSRPDRAERPSQQSRPSQSSQLSQPSQQREGRHAGQRPRAAAPPRPAPPAERDPVREPTLPVAVDPGSGTGVAVAATLQRLLTLSGIQLAARPIATDDGTSLEVDGADLKLVTQKDSELLFALQFLLNRMAPRSWPDAGHIHIVCHSERRQRDEEVVEMARQKAHEVLRTGEPCTLPPMNAYERRLVHLAIREFDTLTSHSEGDGVVKCVEIAPRD